MNNKTRITFLFFTSLAIFLFVYFSSDTKEKSSTKTEAKNILPYQQIPEVTTITVKKQEIQIFKTLPARTSAYKISQVRPQADGIIKKRLFDEGSFVEAGQALYQIDPAIYQADYKNAYAKLKNAQVKKDRYEKLLKIDAVSRQEYDDAVTAVTQAQEEVKKAETHLNYTRIYAPISGYAGKSNITEGALVSANQSQTLTTITQLDPIFADISIATKDLMTIGNQVNIPVTAIIDDIKYDNEGVLKFSEVFTDESTDSVQLRAEFSNKNQTLLPGMFINTKLHLKPIEAIIIPQRVTSRGADGNLTVWIVNEDNIASSRVIKADETFGNHWIVSQGLKEGERVIYKGFQKISEGATVKSEPQIEPVSLKLIDKFAFNSQ